MPCAKGFKILINRILTIKMKDILHLTNIRIMKTHGQRIGVNYNFLLANVAFSEIDKFFYDVKYALS